jgi:chromosome segregation ATPase
MWIWLTISIVLVIGCIIFGIYSFISSRTLQRTISAEPDYKRNNMLSQYVTGPPLIQQQTISNLKIKLKSVEENAIANVYNLNELQKRVEALESASKNETTKDEDWENSEDWEKLYYDTRREKQSLENNLETLKVALQEKDSKMYEFEKQQSGLAALKSELESKANEVSSLHNIIDELQRKLEGTREREKELEQQVAYENSRYVSSDILQKQNGQLQSEIDMLTAMLQQVNDQNSLLEKKIKTLTELGSILEISEYEKMGIKNSVEQLLQKL